MIILQLSSPQFQSQFIPLVHQFFKPLKTTIKLKWKWCTEPHLTLRMIVVQSSISFLSMVAWRLGDVQGVGGPKIVHFLLPCTSLDKLRNTFPASSHYSLEFQLFQCEICTTQKTDNNKPRVNVPLIDLRVSQLKKWSHIVSHRSSVSCCNFIFIMTASSLGIPRTDSRAKPPFDLGR